MRLVSIAGRMHALDESGVSVLGVGARMNWAVGLNYRDHAAETGRDVPTAPTLFAKSPGSLIAHEEPIVVPPHVTQPDYEGEVAVVIGRAARDVSEADALD